MKLKRGILIAIVLYIATLIVNTIIIIIARNSSSLRNSYTFYWLVIIISIIVLTGLASIWYFTKAKRNIKEGLKLGITFILTGFAIDLITFLVRKNRFQLIKEYYSTIQYYVALILIVATCFYIGSRGQVKKPQHHKTHKKQSHR